MTLNKSDLSGMSLSELRKLRDAIGVAIREHERKARKDAKAELKRKAEAMGFSIEELFGAEKTKAAGKTAKGAPKYADPANPGRTWTGRGRRPGWVEAWLAQGKALDDLRI